MSQPLHTAKTALKFVRQHLPGTQTVAAAAAVAGNPAPLLYLDACTGENRGEPV